MKIDCFRLLVDPPASGAWNMAVDEALLESAISGGLATLRFYAWEEPTLSLGYFQSAADREQHVASEACPLVRRSSGGGAILHDQELTYSISLPVSAARDSAIANELYDAVHGSLVDILSEIGVHAELYRPSNGECDTRDKQPDGEPFLCFQRRACGDVVCGGVKICGSAQRRRRGALLQHGSLLLRRSDFAPELPGLAEQSGRAISGEELRVRWQSALAGRVGSSFVEGQISSADRDRADLLASNRFGAAEFAGRR